MRLPTLLLVMVVVCNYGYFPIAAFAPDPIAAERAMFYVLSGMQSTVLFVLVWWLTPFKPLAMRFAVSVACLWGAIESALRAVCMIPFGSEPAAVEAGKGLCSALTGKPTYLIIPLAVLFVTAIRFEWAVHNNKVEREQ